MAVIDDPANYLPDNNGDGIPDFPTATGMVDNAAPEAVSDQRGLIGQVMGMLGNQQGMNPQTIAQQAGVGTPDVNAMSSGDLVQMTLHLARTNPEIVAQVAQHFPAAQPLLAMLTGGAGGQSAGGGGIGGGLLGGLLGRVLGGGRS